ncbi:MAG: hypothetical protein IPN48_15970 [Sphingomonadales bacterium]|nr:hypothetical protein [Sphingomonadales bacterium]
MRLRHERAGNSGALGLSARKTVRGPVEQGTDSRSHYVIERERPLGRTGNREGKILPHSQVGQEPCPLKHVPDVAPMRRHEGLMILP